MSLNEKDAKGSGYGNHALDALKAVMHGGNVNEAAAADERALDWLHSRRPEIHRVSSNQRDAAELVAAGGLVVARGYTAGLYAGVTEQGPLNAGFGNGESKGPAR